MIETLKSIPKDYVRFFLLKAIAVLLGILTVGFLLVFVTVTVLAINHVDLWVIVASAWIIWLLYISIFFILFMMKKSEIEHKLAILIKLTSTEVLTHIGLSVFRFFRKHHKRRKLKES